MESNFKLVLVDLEGVLCQEFEKAFDMFEGVSVQHGRFEDVEFDCIVSAANSFGLMDGGVDGAITMYFGNQLMYRVQQTIIKEYHGEQPVGTSFIIRGNAELNDGNNKYVAHTPTMRVPMNIRGTENVYQAMRAMLIEVHKFNERVDSGEYPPEYNRINTVACTGLGTLCGEIPYRKAALDMAVGYEKYLNPPTHIDWDFARERHMSLNKIKFN